MRRRCRQVKERRSSDPTVRGDRADARWRVRADWEETLLGRASPDWFALEKDARAVVVKADRARITWRVSLGPTTVFAKVVDHPRWHDRLKRAVVGDSPAREWRIGLELEARGVPAVVPVAFGVRLGRQSRSVLLTESVAGTIRLSEFWEREVAGAAPCRGVARDLIEALAQLFALSHERGFVHGDEHAGNILVRAATPEPPELRFVDLAAGRLLRGPASRRQSLRSLAQMDQYFRHRATRTERLRFFRRYRSKRAAAVTFRRPSKTANPWTELEERKLLARCAKLGIAHNARLVRQRDRRLRRDGKYFATLRLGHGWKATVTLALERRHRFPESHVPDRTKADWHETLAALIPLAEDTTGSRASFDRDGFHVEVYRPGSPVSKLLALSVRRLFERCHRRRHRDLPDDLILACARRRRRALIDMTLVVLPRDRAKSV